MERIYHRWENWECYRAGFFEEHPPKGMTIDDCQNKYAEFLRDIPLFEKNARKIIKKWKNSCEHNLTNPRMNRIAWIGQTSVCIKYGIPAKFRGGFHLLNEDERLLADKTALKVINHWMTLHGHDTHTLESISSRTEANLY